ncbi:alpha/beta hydrolase family protein [Lentzea atacamensis]|uniref:Alpha/beta hydrolase family protein n=1 Tax=Lentzea atacamensis TaxID=531938 RepID=A0A316IJA8_9PSEU|nr:alpha/beta hydrolase [Lentzea atacamensis]PWK90398.1 alpha/beta hydrolase family protein [Lentzea atacamensis]
MSYTDPESLYGKLAAGDAGRIAAAADPITGAISAVGRAGELVAKGGKTAVSSWSGETATKFTARADLSATAAKAAGERLGAGAEIVRAASQAYGQMRTAADQAIGVWRSRPPGLDEEQTRTLANQVNDSLSKVKSGYENVLRSYAGALTKIPPGFEESARTDCGWGRAASGGATGPQIPGPNTDPKAVAEWWKSLTPEQQQALLRDRFQELGKLRGLPSDVLDTANRRRINDDLSKANATIDQSTKAINERAAQLGLDPNNEAALRNSNDPQLAKLLDERLAATNVKENCEKAKNSLIEADETSRDKFNGENARVMAWDPTGPRGDAQIAVAFGNPDTAKNLAVCVPGTGSDVGAFSWNQAANLREEMGGGKDNATIQWLGYDAPGWSPGEVDNPAQAREGGQNLVKDVDGYRAAGPDGQHLTVIGHSYGSATVGYAGMNGLKADDIAFVGSPGVGASNVNQLSAGPGHVYVGGTEHDPVVQGTSSNWFTEDGSSTGPYDKEFGGTHFGTTSSKGIAEAHSAYYDENSESLDNLAKIATGRGNEVSSDPWYDRPTSPNLPGSDLPVVGPVLDWGSGVVKEGVDMAGDAYQGGKQVVGDISRGDWGAAGGHAWDTAKEVGSDALDATVDTVGKTAELGRDVYEGGKAVVEGGVEVVKDAGGAIADGAKSAYDNTIGRIF